MNMKKHNCDRIIQTVSVQACTLLEVYTKSDGDNHLGLAVAISVGIIVSLSVIFARQAQGDLNFEMPNLKFTDYVLAKDRGNSCVKRNFWEWKFRKRIPKHSLLDERNGQS